MSMKLAESPAKLSVSCRTSKVNATSASPEFGFQKSVTLAKTLNQPSSALTISLANSQKQALRLVLRMQLVMLIAVDTQVRHSTSRQQWLYLYWLWRIPTKGIESIFKILSH